MSETKPRSHFIPQTKWQALYFSWFVVCFLMVWLGTWLVNEPVPVLGMPAVYVWCSGWGLAWLIGCLWLGLKIEKERGASLGE